MKYEDITKQVGVFEDTPLYRTWTAEQQKRTVEEYGIPWSDAYDFYFKR